MPAILAFLQTELLPTLAKLGCAMLVGLVIGTERERTNRPAGMRTHILVSLGACVAAIAGVLIFKEYSALGATPDPARLAAQVITGVGFLGAGTIMREGMSVKGLTTAASVWATACLGLAAGFGHYALSISGMLLIFLTLTVLEVLEKKVITPRQFHDEFVAETEDIAGALSKINELAAIHGLQIANMQAEKTDAGHRIRFTADCSGSKSQKRRAAFFEALAAAEVFWSVRRMDEGAKTAP